MSDASSDIADIRVLHVVGGRLAGGAARGARILSDELRRQGVNSTILCADPAIDAQEEGHYSVASGLWRRARHVARSMGEKRPGRRVGDGSALFSPGRHGCDLTKHPAYEAADLIHLHWINGGMLSVEGIGRIQKPMVWTLRDMWPFTGGCHYALDCTGYTRSCGACPQLGSNAADDLSADVLQRKNASFSSDTTYVGISPWITEAAASSSLLSGRDIRTILNCIDTSAFYPTPREEARARLGLPQTGRIVLSGALFHKDRYKGHDLLRQAKEMLSHSDFRNASFGALQQDEDIDFDFGTVTDDRKLRDIYAASDVLVFPSIQEAFGKVAAEAMACGVPVVAFDATGPKDIVTHKTTGYAARPFEAADLAAGVKWCLEDPARHRELSENAAKDARARFAPEIAAQAYMDLYREKLSGRAVPA